MSDWNDAIEAAAKMADRLGGDRPLRPVPLGHDKDARTALLERAQHVRAASIAAAIRSLKRPEIGQ